MLRLYRRFFGASAVLLALACAGPSAPSPLTGGATVAASPAVSPVANVFDLTNAERRKAGVPELTQSTQLAKAAQLQSEQMESARLMDHVIPGAAYPNPSDRLAAVDYSWSAYGENVAMGQRSGTEVMSAWMNSAGHRANILNPTFTEFGIGYAADSQGRIYYTEVFGRPAR